MAAPAARYGLEIAQMMSVLGANANQDAVRYAEDVVRSQIQDMITAARDLAYRRGSRLLQTEDLLFLHRSDRARSARLRAFLSLRDTSRRYYGSDADEAEGFDEIIADAANDPRPTVRAKWDALSTLAEGFVEEVEEGLADQQVAFETNVWRLQEDDKLTRELSLEDYRRYTEAREATFTWKKCRRFRDFINLGANVDPPAIDEITDVLGFLAFEIVKQICTCGLTIATVASPNDEAAEEEDTPAPAAQVPKRGRTSSSPKTDGEAPTTPSKRPRLSMNPSATTSSAPSPPDSSSATPRTLSSQDLPTVSLLDGPFATRRPSPPPLEVTTSATSIRSLPRGLSLSRTPLTASQVDQAYLDLQEAQCKPKIQGLRLFQKGFRTRRSLA